MAWEVGVVQPVALTALGPQYRRYRLADPSAEEARAGSLRRWGQAQRAGQAPGPAPGRGRPRKFGNWPGTPAGNAPFEASARRSPGMDGKGAGSGNNPTELPNPQPRQAEVGSGAGLALGLL